MLMDKLRSAIFLERTTLNPDDGRIGTIRVSQNSYITYITSRSLVRNTHSRLTTRELLTEHAANRDELGVFEVSMTAVGSGG